VEEQNRRPRRVPLLGVTECASVVQAQDLGIGAAGPQAELRIRQPTPLTRFDGSCRKHSDGGGQLETP